MLYAVTRWVNEPLVAGGGATTNRLGVAVHVAGPARADRWLFGRLPTTWLQERLAAGSGQWYDVVAALVYVSHFVAIPAVTAAFWFRWRERFSGWLTSVLVFALLGMAGYVLYPAAPPWLAAREGVVGPVLRIPGRGWELMHLQPVQDLIAVGLTNGTPVAAMPSLHAGSALLVAWSLWPVVGAATCAALLLYVALMGITLVYTGEHYAVDVLAGWLTAALAVGAGHVWRRTVRRPRA